jgi:hypothetical protein
VRLLAALALAVPLAAPQAASGRPTLPPTPPDVAARMNGLFAKAAPAVRAWVDAEARKLRSIPQLDATLVAADARQAFPAARAPLTPGQADVLAAMALYQVANDLDSEARLTEDATPEAFVSFQGRKNVILRTLSTVLARISRLDETIVQNLR